MTDPVTSALRSLSIAAGVAPDVAKSIVTNRDQLLRALLQFPLNPNGALPGVIGSAIDGLGERIVRLTLAIFGDDTIRSGVQGAAMNVKVDGAADVLRPLQSLIIEPVVAATGVPDAGMRAALIAAHLSGLIGVRYGARVEPLASASEDDIVAWYAPIIQQLLDPTIPLDRA
jgi:hypothetical protein